MFERPSAKEEVHRPSGGRGQGGGGSGLFTTESDHFFSQGESKIYVLLLSSFNGSRKSSNGVYSEANHARPLSCSAFSPEVRRDPLVVVHSTGGPSRP